MVQLDFLTDPAGFLAAAGDHLAADPVVNTVIASIAARAAAQVAEGIAQPAHDWWLVAREGGTVVGVAMRTAPAQPRPLYVLPMPADAAVALARALHERGEEVTAVNGYLPAAHVCAGEAGRLIGRVVHTPVHMRLHRADAVVPPPTPPGALRRARGEESELVQKFFEGFFVDADAQAGRPFGAHIGEVPSLEHTRWRVEAGEVWLWEDAGTPVHMTCVNPPAYGVSRIGPVYTPAEHRGRGYAGAAVAALTRRALDAGDTPCLFTDQANPVSNKLYAGIGYRPVVDHANLVLE